MPANIPTASIFYEVKKTLFEKGVRGLVGDGQTIFNNFVYGSFCGIHFLKDAITGKNPGAMTVVGHGSDGCSYSLFVEDAGKNTKLIAIKLQTA